MKTLLALTLVGTFTASVYALPSYDAFAYPDGAALPGQTDFYSVSWTAAGPAGADVTVAPGNLSYPYLPVSAGSRIEYGYATGPSARYNFGQGSPVTSGSLFYSFIFKVEDLGSLNTSGGFFAAFNNSVGSQTGTPTIVGAAVTLRRDAGDSTGFNIGVKKSAGGPVWDTAVFHPSDEVFLVGSYTFGVGGGTTDDQADLWINPTTGFGGSAPGSDLQNTIGNDIGGATQGPIASFIFFRRGNANSGIQPADMFSDELRVGTTWAEVTSLVPEPTTAALAGLGLLALALRNRSGRR